MIASFRPLAVAAIALSASLAPLDARDSGAGCRNLRPRSIGSIAPFAVLDGAGQPFALPFLGGLDVPRPQFVDIDADGDLDLFVQEYSNFIWFFENTGKPAAPKYEWRSDRYQNLEVGEWYRFVDLDGDGDVDLLGEQPFSNIRWYRNTGSRQAAKFEPVAALQDTDGQVILLDRQNIPAIVDLDCDNRLDFFIGRVEGTVTRYEADAPGSARFAFITDRFEDIEIIGGGGLDADHGTTSQPPARRAATARTRWHLPTSTATRTSTCSGATSSRRACS